jgi:general secretion pathway protein G
VNHTAQSLQEIIPMNRVFRSGYAQKSVGCTLPSAGFTLIEVMVVVVILGILGALIVPNIISRPDEARVTAARIEIKQIESALQLYKLDNRNYPSTDQGLEALVSPPSGYPEAESWNPAGYLPKIPTDPWDEPYLYFSDENSIEVYTYGADKKEGGEQFDADILLSDL